MSEVLTRGLYRINLSDDPFIPQNWKVYRHIKQDSNWLWDPEELVLRTAKIGEYIDANELANRIGTKDLFNANLLDYLLSYSEIIPKEWIDKSVYFFGTIYLHPTSLRVIRCLFYNKYNNAWEWYYTWERSSFSYPLAIVAKKNI